MKKKKTTSLRRQIFVLMALLVAVQSLALALALFISQVFTKLDAEAFRLFSTTVEARAEEVNKTLGELVASMTAETPALAGSFVKLAREYGLGPEDITANDELYEAAAVMASDVLLHMLAGSGITGAFVMFEDSNASPQNPLAHSSVYIRNTAVSTTESDTSNYSLEIGPVSISRQHRIPTSINWRLDILFDSENERDYLFYQRPIEASREQPRAEIQRYGYWARPVALLDDRQPAIFYTMPLLDAEGAAFGVMGVEITQTYVTQNYLSNTELPYQNSFYAVTGYDDGAIELDWFLPSSPLALTYLQKAKTLPVSPTDSEDVQKTEIEGLGDMYCSLHPLVMYSRNSPFYDDGWYLVGFVGRDVLHETSTSVRNILVGSIVITTLLAFVAVFFLTYFSTREIPGLSKYIKTLSPNREITFRKTGLSEIDELTAAIEQLNRSVINSSKVTSKIMELTSMPMGGFETTEGSGYVSVTEYLYTLMGMEVGAEVPRAQWEAFHSLITAEPVADTENVYRYVAEGASDITWLRILETPTETGHVGVVLDVTKDVEENRRLAHELDFDSLTRLYSRTAFKREAHARIGAEPNKIGAMIFIDLDNLKYINDTFGHDVGDRLLIRAGDMFSEFKQYGGIVSRISGDEFAIYLHGYDSKDEVRAILAELTTRHDEYTLATPDGGFQRIRSSAGLAWYPDDSYNVTDLLKLSDFAMYEAKHNQKGTMFEFSRESYSENAYLLENREAISRLLDERLIHFAFQPIVSLATGEVYGYEALMRPLLANFLSPAEILSVAAAQGKLYQLELLVMQESYRYAQEHFAELGDARLFVNSIPSQKLDDKDIQALRDNYSRIMDRVVLELTESDNYSASLLLKKVKSVRQTGHSIAIDDYGSGHSNEIRILSLSPEIIKIDMAIIQGIHADADKQTLVSNLLGFCRLKKIMTVAEGVETAEDLAEVIRLGVDFVQGFYISLPEFSFMPPPARVKEEILTLREGMRRTAQ